MYKVKNLCFSYSNKEVLKDVTFSIDDGKCTTIIGPNGSGKTTLLNLITGQFDTYSGEVYFRNKLLKNYSIKELSQKIAIVSQNVDIRFPFTCMEVVMMGRTPFKNRMKHLSEKDLSIIYKSMEMTETLKFVDIPITNLSGGEKQRVMMAKALSQTPEVLFLDEAFSNMDIKYTIKFLNLLREMTKKENLTVISIMHDLNFTYMFSDRILALKNGELTASNTTEKVMTPELIKDLFGVQIKKSSQEGLIILPTI